ncbi:MULTISPECIES: hemin ABC transporter substrate-binding protein [Corynebacterium]|uniref:heme/hemin ABC transporter substrate-binding protein n=1 Tax=Corynebacterium TaxID=1716 RepID=UPI001CE47611|nr:MULTISPECIES: ABC transporter substrate-binding protein [Corynebacterium]
MAFTAVMLSGMMLWASCGINTDNGARNAAAAQETSFDAVMEQTAQWTKKDPRATKGVSEAELVGDVTPISDSVTPTLPVSLTDADGYDVEVTDVSRILPLDLYGTTSRTIAGLGLRDNIVGRTVSSMEPSLADLPVVTQGGHNLNVEAILNLRPSLVIVDHSIGPDTAIDQIRDAGVTVVVLNPTHSLDSIGEDIQNIAGVVGLTKEGKQLAERAERERDEAIAKIKEVAPDNPLRMAFIYARGTGGVFFILGPDSGTDDLISSVGGVDTSVDAGITDMTPANAEALAKINPEVIVMMTKGLESAGGLEGLLAKPGVSETEAGKNQRIVTIPDSQSLSFGPQTGEMILSFAKALYQ